MQDNSALGRAMTMVRDRRNRCAWDRAQTRETLRPYLVEEAIRGMDEAGVAGAILHPPTSWDPESNEQAVEAVLAYPGRFAILANPPLDQPDSRMHVATWKTRPVSLTR